MVQTTLEKCAGCGKWKIIGIQAVEHGFTPAHGSSNLALLWDTGRKLCPDCNRANVSGYRQPDPTERFTVRHWWSGLPVIERGVYVSNGNFI